MLQWLQADPEWRLVQLDEVAAVFVRVGDDPSRWQEIGTGGSDLLAPLADPRDSELDLRRRAARFALLHALGRPERARELAHETCSRHGERSEAPFFCRNGAREEPRQLPGR